MRGSEAACGFHLGQVLSSQREDGKRVPHDFGGKKYRWRKLVLSAGVIAFSFSFFLFYVQFQNLGALHGSQLADTCLFIIQVHALLKELVHKAISETIVSFFHFQV